MHRKLITLSTTLANHKLVANVSLAGKTVRAVVFDIEPVTVGRHRELIGKAMVGGKAVVVRASGFGEVWRIET